MTPHSDQDQVQSYLDGELAGDALTAFEQRLAAEPALADLLLSLSREEAILTEWARSNAVQAEMASPAASAGKSGFRRRLEAMLFFTAAAAVIIAILGKFGSNPPAPSPLPVGPSESADYAKLEDMHGEVYVVRGSGEPMVALMGQALPSGARLQTKGEGSYAVVKMSDSSRFALGNDTTFRIGSAMPSSDPSPTVDGPQVYLEEGTVAADVPQQPANRPMVVATPHAEVRIADSRASITSVPRGTRIEQEKGQAQLVRKSDGQAIDLQTGWFAVAPAQKSTEQFKPQPMPTAITQAKMIVREGIGPLQSAAFSPDGARLAIGAADGTVRVLNLTESQLAWPPVRTGKAQVRAIAFAPNGSLVAATGDDKQLKLVAAGDGAELATLKNYKHPILCLAFSPDGSLLATGGGGKQGEIKVWNVEARLEIASLSGHTNGVLAVTFSPDGRSLATGGRDGSVKLWDIAAGKERLNLTAHSSQVNALAFSADGALLASAGKDMTVKLWDMTTGKEARTFQGLSGDVRALAFSADGKRLAAADQTLRLWDLEAGQQLGIFKGHRGGICAMSFAADGKHITTAGWDRTIRSWDIPEAQR
ncbi:MAG: FecR domain-containing protein [Planctomycetia bacterium]|nr:FecR domain-containing protein [Planctomycetia bacterium]